MNEEKVFRHLVLGLRSYCSSYGFSSAVLGISGGIDSALTAAIAVKALGKENVVGLFLPSKFTSKESRDNAVNLARNLGMELHEIPIQEIYNIYIKHLRKHFKGTPVDKTEQNLQARIRANILMAFSNKFGYLVLVTGNKSESMVGYFTLYGDAAGGIAPIGNLYKRDVYKLARFMKGVIPCRIIERAPTAELKPNQKDEDDIPEYGVLDEILHLMVDKKMPAASVAKRFDKQTVNKIIDMVKSSEFKRGQTPKALPLK